MTKLPLSPNSDEPRASEGPHDRPRPTAAVRDHVLSALGWPPGLYRVAVVPLWLNYYRVNVLVGTDPSVVKVAHSYFVSADEDGYVLTSAPPITRLYQ